MGEPIQLDKGIPENVLEFSENGDDEGKDKKRNGMRILLVLIAVIAGVAMVVALSFTSGGSFRENPSPGEQAIRDSLYVLAQNIHQFYEMSGRLPEIPGDLHSSVPGLVYVIEDDSTWFIEVGDSIELDFETDLEQFKKAEI